MVSGTMSLSPATGLFDFALRVTPVAYRITVNTEDALIPIPPADQAELGDADFALWVNRYEVLETIEEIILTSMAMGTPAQA